ncbi:hypothetical protein [Streptomyces sp. HM190]|uniref:hypothetical protein n=1 Tax=Streptomyces sp. HM190 TaxID=2695266 RepID=UPI00135840D5|nr:hypothetical protein [Streptomyces sp. HM190]
MAKGPKAVMLGGRMDPLARYVKAVGHLKQVIEEVPGTALLHTDLAAFGAPAFGAAFTAFGAGSRCRHIIAPGGKAQTNTSIPVQSPHVLFPDLMAFFLGETIAERYGGAEAPLCFCSACADRLAPDAFTSNRGELPAAAAPHNVAVLMEWLRANGVDRENQRDKFPQVNTRFTEKPQVSVHHPHSLHEWQDFSHRLHEAGHQPYCLVWP